MGLFTFTCCVPHPLIGFLLDVPMCLNYSSCVPKHAIKKIGFFFTYLQAPYRGVQYRGSGWIFTELRLVLSDDWTLAWLIIGLPVGKHVKFGYTTTLKLKRIRSPFEILHPYSGCNVCTIPCTPPSQFPHFDREWGISSSHWLSQS